MFFEPASQIPLGGGVGMDEITHVTVYGTEVV